MCDGQVASPDLPLGAVDDVLRLGQSSLVSDGRDTAPQAAPRHGCLFGVGVAGAFLLVPALVLVLTLRACTGGNDLRFSAKVVDVHSTDVCFALVSDGPGYLNNRCVGRGEVVDLPTDVRVGDCVRLNQHLHGALVYEGKTNC